MTAVTASARRTGGPRILNVVRMQLVNRQTYIWIPLIVLFGTLLITLAIWGVIIGNGGSGNLFGGGAQAPLWYFGVVGVQALTLTFPFSQAMSVSRREFFFGTLLTAAMTALILAIVFVLGAFIETVTNGWGMNGYFFALPGIWDAGAAVAGLFYFSIAMLFFIVGFTSATIYKHFGGIALTVVLVGLGALLVLAMFLIGRLNAWGPVFTWFAELGILGGAFLVLGVVAVLSATAYGILRRATP